jgi:DNA-binding CsgD family transcriptional regulator
MMHRGRPLPWAIRQRIAALRAAGASLRQIAAVLRISINTVQKYLRQV